MTKLSNYPLPNPPLSMCPMSQKWAMIKDRAQPEERQIQYQGLAWGFTHFSVRFHFPYENLRVRIESSFSAWTYLRFDFVILSDSSNYFSWMKFSQTTYKYYQLLQMLVIIYQMLQSNNNTFPYDYCFMSIYPWRES